MNKIIKKKSTTFTFNKTYKWCFSHLQQARFRFMCHGNNPSRTNSLGSQNTIWPCLSSWMSKQTLTLLFICLNRTVQIILITRTPKTSKYKIYPSTAIAPYEWPLGVVVSYIQKRIIIAINVCLQFVPLLRLFHSPTYTVQDKVSLLSKIGEDGML